jgi:hypothetical protein
MVKGQKSWKIMKKGHEKRKKARTDKKSRKQKFSGFFSFTHGKHYKKLENEEKRSQYGSEIKKINNFWIF